MYIIYLEYFRGKLRIIFYKINFINMKRIESRILKCIFSVVIEKYIS